MKYVWYMISSIIMSGAEDRRNIIDARKVAKEEAVKLSLDKEYGKTYGVTIDKYNTRTKRNITIESWWYRDGKFICEKENRVW